jgi:hypothetical protein
MPVDTQTVVKDLAPGDRLPYGTYLGALTAAQELTVKTLEAASDGKFAVTFHGVGTLFIHGDQPVRAIRVDR